MRRQAIIVLLAIGLGIVASPSLPLMLTHSGKTSISGTLDVCHPASPALSSNGEMPCMSEFPRDLSSLVAATMFQPVNSRIKPPFIAFPDERPPKA